MKKKRSIFYPVVFMSVLAFVLTFILAYLNDLTKPVIKFNSDIELKRKILYVFEIKPESSDSEYIDREFNEGITESEYDGKVIYERVEDGETVAYAVPFEGPGLWGTIRGYVGISGDLKTILGIDFIKQDETPGLGGRIIEEFYKEQYRGIDISNVSDDDAFIVNRPAPGGNIDAIAGATQTSQFVVNMINEDLLKFIEEKGAN